MQALRPIAALLQPLQMQLWRDTHPSARDIESALSAAGKAAIAVAAARAELLQGVTAAPVDVAVPGLGLSNKAPTATPVREPQHAAAGAASSGVTVQVHALNRFCWDTDTQPHVAEAAALAATAALPPGTDMSMADVAAAHAAAEQAALAAVQHAQLLSTLPMWLVPGETGNCCEALKHAATLLPMPAYGLSLRSPATTPGAVASTTSSESSTPMEGGLSLLDQLAALTAQCVQPLLALQASGPYVIVGSGVFSCMLAAAMACELEHQPDKQVVLVVLDGPPVVPTAVTVPDPVVYGLYQLARDNGTLPALIVNGTTPQPFASFAAEVSIQLQAAMTGGTAVQLTTPSSAAAASSGPDLPVLPPVEQRAVPTLEDAVQQVALSRFVTPGGLNVTDVTMMMQTCRIARQMLTSYMPDYMYQGPAVMVLTEDAEGRAFLEAGRESCGGELSLVPLIGLLHGQVLTGEREQQLVIVAVVDGLMEMLQML